jgi:hypothetical protein
LHWALLSSLEPIRTRPGHFARYETRDAGVAWRVASGVPSELQVIRHVGP